MDQCFSIIATELKSEIKTVEELFIKIENAPITPKAEVQHLLFIWDWKKFITPNFSTQMLANHSHYHAFQVKREGYQVSLRCRKYPQDSSWEPPDAIKLVKDKTVYDPVDVAPFRSEDLNLDKIMSDIRTKFLPLLSDDESKQVESSWDRLCTTLLQMPKKCLPKMKLEDIVKQKSAPADIAPPSYVAAHSLLDPPELKGEHHPPPEAEERVFKQDARVGVDVVLWTLSKSTRPWVGRVYEILSENEFVIHWFQRRIRSRTFVASSDSAGSPYLSKQAMSSVMFWQMSVNATEESFDLPEYQLRRIMHEYESHDQCYSG